MRFMHVPGCRRRAPRALAAVAALLLAGALVSLRSFAAEPAIPSETRALWVLRTSLASPQTIQALVRSARQNGFNTLLVQVRGRGDAYFAQGLEPRAAELQRQPDSFDPLATVLAAAHGAGLKVHAWVNVNLVSSAADLPIARTHLVHRHPEWLMVPRDIAQDLARVPATSPAYIGKLARWTRTRSDDIEGLYASPIPLAAAEHAERIVRDIVRRYAVDGVHFDYARYPTERFDYSAGAIREFKASVRLRLAASVRLELDAREQDDLFAYPDALPDEWRAFRVARMTALVERLSTAVRAVRPRAFVSVATAPDLQEAREHRLQDWRAWLETGLVDAVCPMAYTPEPDRFAQQIAAANQVIGGKAIWAGIGAYRLTPTQTIDNIQTARKLGAAGVILFSYDSLTDPRQSSPDYLAVVGRSAFPKTTAAAGSR